jgi:predicted alpha/beta-hydrolase family hydrolase
MEIDTSAGPALVDVTGPRKPRFLMVLTHGAGGTPDTTDVMAARKAGLEYGGRVALVTQPYRVRGGRAPGSAPRQDGAWVELVGQLRDDLSLVQGGRSNGARVACRTAAATKAKGVLALAFPLRPPGHPERSRAGELSAARQAGANVLVVNGERDPFGVPEPGEADRVIVLCGQAHALSRDAEAIEAAVASWLREVVS